MPADHAPCKKPYAVGENEDCKKNKGHQDNKSLNRKSHVASKEGNDFGKHTNEHEVNACQQNRERMVQQRVGWIDIDFEMPGAEQAADQQQAGKDKPARVNALKR